MHKTLLTGLLVCMSGLAALSQDIVRLQDGTEVSGKVTEYFVGEHLRLRQADGTFQQYAATAVRKVYLDTHRKLFAVPTRGFFNHSTLNFTIGSSFASALGTSFHTVNGWRLNARWMAGLDVGLEWLRFQRLMPVLANVRYLLAPGKRVAPYLEGAVGYSVPLGDTYYDGSNSVSWWSKAYGRTSGGVSGSLQFGLQKYWSPRIGCSFSAGIRYQHLKAVYPDAYFEGVQVQFASVERMNWLLGQVGVGMLFR